MESWSEPRVVEPAELERLVDALATGEVDEESFVRTLANTQLLVLLDREIEEGAPDLGAMPLVLRSPEGYQALAVFSSAERGQAAAERFPGYPVPFLTTARWLLGRLHPELGLLLNIAGPRALGIAPEGVERVRAEVGDEAEAAPVERDASTAGESGEVAAE